MYVKLFSSILDSTIWVQEPPSTRLIWITMLAMANEIGVVEAAVPGLAKRAGVSVSDARIALETLESPDPDSRSPEYEGRRIQTVDGGWLLLNYEKYREVRTKQQILKAQRQQRYRDRKRASTVDEVDESSSEVAEGGATPASASASAFASVVEEDEEKMNGDIFTVLAEEHHEAVRFYLTKAGKHRPAVQAEIKAAADGLRGKAFSWQEIGQALHEMHAGQVEKFGVRIFRGYLRNLKAPADTTKPRATSFADVEVPQ